MIIDKRLKLFEKACFIRAFEAEIAAAHDDGAVPGLVHLADGAELFEAALIAELDMARDQVTGSHRSHGLALACGLDAELVAREILGRAGGLSDGLGGTQHLLAPERGFLGSNGIVGAQVPLALGAALSAKTLNTGGIAVAFFGDGAANQGGVAESLNLAAVLDLPVLFVMENNGFGQSTHASYASAGGMLARARANGLAADHVDGGDMTEVSETAARLVNRIRSSGTPGFLEASVPRLGGHFHGDPQAYRDTGALPGDPLDRAAAAITAKAEEDVDLNGIREQAAGAARAAVTAARQAPDESDKALARWQEARS